MPVSGLPVLRNLNVKLCTWKGLRLRVSQKDSSREALRQGPYDQIQLPLEAKLQARQKEGSVNPGRGKGTISSQDPNLMEEALCYLCKTETLQNHCQYNSLAEPLVLHPNTSPLCTSVSLVTTNLGFRTTWLLVHHLSVPVYNSKHFTLSWWLQERIWTWLPLKILLWPLIQLLPFSFLAILIHTC